MSLAIKRLRAAGRAPNTEPEILEAILAVAKANNDNQGIIPLLERLIELNPDDYKKRFDLAYACSQNRSMPLAFLHYSKIPEHERHGATWNNLGAASDTLGLRVQSVDAYRKSEASEETLAMSNLANKFLKGGFLQEALALCEKALGIKDPHKNVGSTWSDAKALPEEEDKRRDEILAKAAPISDFYRQMGHALAQPEPGELASTWTAPETSLTVTVTENGIVAEGSYEVPSLGGLVPLWTATPGLRAPPPPMKYRITYKGVISGKTVRGTVYRRLEAEDSRPKSLLETIDDQNVVLMVVSDDGRELKVMERIKEDVRFYSLNARTPSPS